MRVIILTFITKITGRKDKNGQTSSRPCPSASATLAWIALKRLKLLEARQQHRASMAHQQHRIRLQHT